MPEEMIVQQEWKGWARKTGFFLAGEAVSLFGSALVQYAIIWYITLQTESGVMMTFATICGFLPQLLISLFAGVWADRYPRKTLIILADAGIAVATLALAITFLAGYREIWLLFVIAGIRSFGSGIQSPAVSSMIPQLVPEEKLMKVNGLHNSINSFTMLVAPVVSGALLAATNLEVTFFIDVITAAIAIGILLALPIKPHAKALEAQKTGYFTDLGEGLRYIRGHSLIRSILFFYAIFFFLVVPVALLNPLMVVRSFGPEVWKLTVNEVVYFSGAMMGGLFISLRGGFQNRRRTIVVSCVLFGFLSVAMGLAPTFLLYLIVIFISGLCVPFFDTAITVTLQQKVETSMQGRIFSFIQIIVTAVMPVGMAVFGPLADVVSVELLLIVTGGLMAVLGLIIRSTRAIRSI